MNVISKIKCEVIRKKLKSPFITALHEVDEMQAVKVYIKLNNGLIGIGTATPNEKVTGDTLKSTYCIMEDIIKPQLLKKSIDEWNKLLYLLQNIIANNTPAKAAYEIALYDLRSKLEGVSLTYMLGNGKYEPITTDYTISIKSHDQVISDAKNKVKEGFHFLKIKLGNGNFNKDVQIPMDLAIDLPNDVSFRIDINQAWTVKETLYAIKEWTKFGLNIDFVEQPVNKLDVYGMKLITEKSSYNIMADESVFSPSDALLMIRNHACDLINIKLMKTGGISQAQKINDIAEASGIKCMIECPESISAAISFASSNENVIYADLDSVYMIDEKEDFGFSINKDKLIPSKKIGLGGTNEK